MHALVVVTALALAADAKPAAGLTPKEVADGWVMLFDGESTFGWAIDGEAKVEKGVLILGGAKATTARTNATFGQNELMFGIEDDDARPHALEFCDGEKGGTGERARPICLTVAKGKVGHLSKMCVKPLNLQPLFNGKDLTGWKVHPGEKYKSKFTVTPEGWLNVKDGPGDLQTEKTFGDFVLQFDCISHGKWLNSGVFFRCLPGQYQQGYEAQIRNQWLGDRTVPVDFGTGAIYRRQPARKVVSTDNEWFTMTVLARGDRLMTWVNGYPVADWQDTRPKADNARQGLKVGPGHISIQGHDPTTNLSFRNIRAAELPVAK